MYQAVYKCRLCGKEYTKCTVKTDTIALECICGIMDHKYLVINNHEIAAQRIDCHECEDGSFGVADFEGFKKV